MRFSTSNVSFNKLAGFAAALMILPVAVSCGSDTTAELGSDELSEAPAAVEGEMEAMPDAPTATGIDPAGESIVDVAAADGSFNTLVAAAQATGLDATLDSDGPFTVFAPTDEAFAALPADTVEKLVKPENQQALTDILAYHVVDGAVTAAEIVPGSVGTVEGGAIDVAVEPSGVVVNGEANVVQPDVAAENGVIHVIDTVLLPPTFDPSTLI